jgi:hypothetical protein
MHATRKTKINVRTLVAEELDLEEPEELLALLTAPSSPPDDDDSQDFV